MIKRIVLRDFLAHKHTEIELGEGLTVIAGPNNSGKSAVVEGLRCLASNPAPQHFIRHGAKEARVSVELEDDVVVTWVRRSAYAMYEVQRPGEDDPQVYAKFGRNPPEEVLALLRLDKVAVDDTASNAVDVHIGNQREPIFLLDRPGTAAAAFFAASSESAYLLAMQKALKNRVQDAKNRDRLLSERLAELASDLDAMERLPDAELSMDAAEARLAEIEAVCRAIPALEAHLVSRRRLDRLAEGLARRAGRLGGVRQPPELAPTAALDGSIRRVVELSDLQRRLERRSQSLRDVQSSPELSPVGRLATIVDGGRSLDTQLLRLSSRSEALEGLSRPPELAETANLARMMGLLDGADRRRNGLESRSRALEGLEDPPALAEAASLAKHLGRRRELARRLAELESRAKAVNELRDAPQLADVDGVSQTLARLRSLDAARKSFADELADRERRLAELVDRTSRRLVEIGACPTCGQRLDAEAFLSREHGHGHS